MLAVGVPAIAAASTLSLRIKHLLFSVMLISLLFGVQASINLMSMEFYRGPVRGFEITLTDLIALALIISMMLRSGSRIIWLPRFFSLLAAFFLFSIVNVLQSEYQIFGWFAVWQLFRMGLIYWCVINFFATEEYSMESVRTLMRSYAVSGVILGAVALKQRYIDGIYRVFVYFDHSNTIPSFVILITCVLLVWSMREERLSVPEHVVTLGGTAGMVFAVFATSSRAGIVTSVMAVFAGVVISNLHRSGDRARRSSLVILLCMVIGGVMMMETVVHRFLHAPEASEQARDEFEVAAIMMADDHPLGVGINQYSQMLTEEEEYRRHIVVMRTEEQAGVAHHIYLLTAAEMGYAGMVFFIVISALFTLSMVIGGLPMRTMEQRLLAGLAVGFIALFAIGFLEWVIRQSPVLYQMTAAAGFGQALVNQVKEKRREAIKS